MTAKKTQPAPFILGKRPEHIAATVKFPLPDGAEAEISVKFAYRTRTEFGALWDEIAASGQSLVSPGSPDETITYEGLMGKGNASNAQNTLKYLVSWEGVPVELNAKNLEQLFDEAPAASSAFWDTYRAAVLAGRVGN